MEIGLLVLLPIDELYHEHQEFFSKLKIVDPLQHLIIIKPAILDILPNLG